MKNEFKYSKEDILKSKALGLNKDVLQVVLLDDKEYSINEVRKLVDDFNKRVVK